MSLPSRFSFALVASFGALPLSVSKADGIGVIAMGSSNYFYRGYSKSDNQPTVRANFDYTHASGFFLGSWVSWVNFGDQGHADRSNVEFYPYVGFTHKLTQQWRIEAEIARYLYDGRIFGKFSDYNEYSASVHYRDFLSVRLDFADDAYQRGAGDINLAVTARYPLFSHGDVSAGVGFNDAIPALEYNALYWNIGLTWFFKYAAVDLRYADAADVAINADSHALSLPSLKQNFIFSLTVGF